MPILKAICAAEWNGAGLWYSLLTGRLAHCWLADSLQPSWHLAKSVISCWLLASSVSLFAPELFISPNS